MSRDRSMDWQREAWYRHEQGRARRQRIRRMFAALGVIVAIAAAAVVVGVR
jgi:hypothetical protein